MSLNKVTLIGRVGKDPEVRSLPNGGRVVTFSIATSERWRNKQTGERVEKTEWHNIEVWGEHLTTIAEKYLSKGDQVYVEGKLATDKWEKDGVQRTATKIKLQGYDARIVLLGSGASGDAREPAARPATDADIDDEIPF